MSMRRRVGAGLVGGCLVVATMMGCTSGGPGPQKQGQSSGATGQQSGTSSSSPATGATTKVRTAAELTTALRNAKPGQVIEMADGTYKGTFTMTTSGTASTPIVLRGGRGAVLDGGDPKHRITVQLQGADFWRLEGFSVRGAQKGVVLDDSNKNVLSQLDVSKSGMEAVHFRSSSSDNRLENSRVHHTGLVDKGRGEGIYIGSAFTNWAKWGNQGGMDRSDRNVVTGNEVYAITAENVDIKEGTVNGEISGNTFRGDGMTGEHHADSWVDAKGNGYRITGNTGVGTRLDGFQTHVQLPGWGENNVFSNNKLTVNAAGYGINIYKGQAKGNVVTCDNVVTGAKAGKSSIGCR
jgi:hypothetical protein